MLPIRLALIILLFLPVIGYSQDTLKYVKSPYRKEYTPHFSFGVFKRGFSNEILKGTLDSLETKPKEEWKRFDSLRFAEVSLQTGNLELAEFYFSESRVDYTAEENYWIDRLMIFYLNHDYQEGLNEIQDASPMILEYSKIYFFKKILEAEIKQEENSKWYKKGHVFEWEVDSSLFDLDKNSELFKEKVLKPLKNLEFVLNKIVSYIHEDDAIIASACREMGHIIEGHLSLTQAFIAYSLGRHYNKWDKDLLADLKNVKSKMTEKKYKIPNFRKYFPRIEYWRFDYEMLKEEIIKSKNDTNTYVIPKTMAAKKEPLISFPHQYIIIGGLAFILLVLMLLLKTRS